MRPAAWTREDVGAWASLIGLFDSAAALRREDIDDMAFRVYWSQQMADELPQGDEPSTDCVECSVTERALFVADDFFATRLGLVDANRACLCVCV